MNDNTDPDSIRMQNILTSFSLCQLVQASTHLSGNTLDLLITSRCTDDRFVDVSVGSYLCGHAFVLWKLHESKPSLERKTIQVRKLNSIEHQELRKDLYTFVRDTTGTEDLHQFVRANETF